MKLKRLPILMLAVCSAQHAMAQTAFPGIEYLNINKFNAAQMLHGDMWYIPATNAAACEYPKGSGKHASYLGALWMAANDGAGTDYLSVVTYRSSGIVDYWPGPLDATGYCSYSTSEKWARIWKVNQSDIVTFKSLSVKSTSTIPKSILEWPAKGNMYAKGGGGISLSITDDMAPFVDVDADGMYNSIAGDYPKIKGDQMLWWVFNDNGALRSVPGSSPFRIEYRACAYGYSRGSDIDNVIYYEFEMRNKSTVRYYDFRFGMFSDADLGYAFDDYIAFDSSHRMGILYNAKLPDGPNGANSYGSHPPLVGFSFIQMPGDTYPAPMMVPGTFNYFNNGSIGVLRDPRTPAEFSNYMYGKDADGGAKYYGNYAYSIKKGAIECDSAHTAGDRRFLTTTGNYNFQPGTSTKVAMAVMATDTTGNACPGVNFKPLTDLADTAWEVYYKPLKPLGVEEITALDKSLRVYPNPASDKLIIDSYTGKTLKASLLKVYDLGGRQVNVPASQSSNQIKIDVSSLAAGAYSLVYAEEGILATQNFVKE